MDNKRKLKDRRVEMCQTYEIPIEDFEHRFFWMFEKIEQYEELDDDRVFIFLNDGRTLLYDNIPHEYYEIKLFDSVMELTDEEWKRGFSRLLKISMRKAQIPQYILAEKIGVTKSMMNYYVTGKSIPSAIILNKLAEELNCLADELLPRKYIILD